MRMRSLAVESLSVRGFRNLAAVDVAFGSRFNVVSGENGQGKTNLLEAVYTLATSRSFRTSKIVDLVQSGGQSASLRARVVEDGETREQSVGVRPGLRVAHMDGKRTVLLAGYAVRTPVVVFHPGLAGLSAGSGAERRRLLDRLALYLWPASLADAESYVKAARARQRVLEVRGERASDLDGWEELMVRHGLALSDAREKAAEQLGESAVQTFARIGPADALQTRYERSAPAEAEGFRKALATSRPRDRARGSATIGPHRDDLGLTLGGRPVRGIASQGQHRAVVLALVLAETHVIAEARGVRPILLLDDVSSELDRSRTAALLRALCERQGQVILTTTRPELFETNDSFGGEDRRDFAVAGGRIEAA
ncbi:MAG: DNA replication and repair protein RecF [Polyangiaceae bacterium]